MSVITVGSSIPDAPVRVHNGDSPQPMQTQTLFGGQGKTCVIVAVHGAFTPTCSNTHVPAFIADANAIRAKGVDEIFVVSVNDAYVMHSWGKTMDAEGKVTMVGDGSLDWTRSVGLVRDMKEKGFGERSHRYAMVVKDGVVTHIRVENPGEFKVSSSADILSLL